MYIIASSLFIIGIVTGALYGFMVEKTAIDIAFSIIVGGFAGSAAGGLVFTGLYLSGQNEDETNVNEPIYDKNLQIDSNPISRMKALPEKSSSSINIFSNDNRSPAIKGTPENEAVTPADSNKSLKIEINTSAEIYPDAEISLNAQINTNNNKAKKKNFVERLIQKFKLSQFKFKTKNFLQKQKSKPPLTYSKNKETDKQKIKRLKKEINNLKNKKLQDINPQKK